MTEPRFPLPVSADDLVDRLVRHHRRRTAPDAAAPATPAPRPVDEALTSLGLGARDLYQRARAHFEHLAPPEPVSPRAPAAPEETATAQLEVRAHARAGGTAPFLFNLDNPSALSVEATFRPSELRRGDACRWAHVRFSPPRVTVPPHGLVQVCMEVDLADEPAGSDVALDVEVHARGRVYALVWATIHVEPA